MRGAKCRSKMRILLGLRPNSGSGNGTNATCASAQSASSRGGKEM